jgi:hypothetical protein
MRKLASVFVVLFLLHAPVGCVRHAVAPPLPGVEGPSTPEPPPGTVAVEVVSDDEGQAWDVSVRNQVVCTTPCSRWFNAGARLTLHSRDGDFLYVPGLGAEAAQARHAVLVAEGSNAAKQVNGIVFTTFGGMGVVTAITLTAVGCSDLERHAGMCSAGLITGAVSVPVTAFAIWLLVDSGPKAHVLPVFKAQTAPGQPPVSFAVTPNGVIGTF